MTSVPNSVPFTINARELEAKAPAPLADEEKEACKSRIKSLLKAKDAVLVVHYYTDPELQALAEETGGYVSDSLDMARFGHDHPASTLVVCGVRFMGETAKILTPEKRVLMPTLEAECSLDLSCPVDAFSEFCDANPDRTVVVYANTSAAVKARADWVVTSSIGLDIVRHLHSKGEKILWAPDRHLGHYIESQTGADMLMWNGTCIVHDAFKANAVEQLKATHPDAGVLVHPESPANVIAMADSVGSTSQLIEAVKALPHQTFIVATDRGIFYKMQQAAPEKRLLDVPTGGTGATCVSCAHCPWMAMNGLQNLEDTLTQETNEIFVEPNLIEKAKISLNRMMDFAAKRHLNTVESAQV